MSSAKTIKVTPETLKTASGKIEGLAKDYETNYKKIYTEVQKMSTHWKGKDNVEFTNQIKGFEKDFKAMKKLMDTYAEFLKKAGQTYQDTLDKVAADAKKIVVQ